MQLGEHNVRLNSISPGAIPTGIFAKAFGVEAEKADAAAGVVQAAFSRVQPVPRAGSPDDIAEAAVFLASDGASFVTTCDRRRSQWRASVSNATPEPALGKGR